MPSFSGRFEHLAPGQGVVRSGPCELSFDLQTVTLVPGDGAPIAFDLGDIDIFESGENELRLSLYTGHDLELTRFAKAFQDLERQLLEAYRDRLVECLLVSDLDEVARFTGRAQIESPIQRCSGPAEIRLYESNLAVLPDAAVGFQWRLADILQWNSTKPPIGCVRPGRRSVDGRAPRKADRRAVRTGALAHHRAW
jgi:hypothetical protein